MRSIFWSIVFALMFIGGLWLQARPAHVEPEVDIIQTAYESTRLDPNEAIEIIRGYVENRKGSVYDYYDYEEAIESLETYFATLEKYMD